MCTLTKPARNVQRVPATPEFLRAPWMIWMPCGLVRTGAPVLSTSQVFNTQRLTCLAKKAVNCVPQILDNRA